MGKDGPDLGPGLGQKARNLTRLIRRNPPTDDQKHSAHKGPSLSPAATRVKQGDSAFHAKTLLC
jgi:hypothetical protein